MAGLGEQVIAGGDFDYGTETRHLLAWSLHGGLLDWNPVIDGDFGFADIDVLSRYPDFLIVSGRFSSFGGRPVLNLAILPTTGAGPPTAMRVRIGSNQAALSWNAPSGTTPSSYAVEVGTATGASDVGRFPVSAPAISGPLPPARTSSGFAPSSTASKVSPRPKWS